MITIAALVATGCWTAPADAGEPAAGCVPTILGRPTGTCPETICVRQTPERHFGLGVVVQDGWIEQSPSFAGYSAVQTYLPGRDIAIAVATTRGRTTTAVNSAETLAGRIAGLLTTPSDG